MANVVTNPDFTILDAGGDPLDWLMPLPQRAQTWEPVLTCGFNGEGGGSDPARGFQMATGEEGRNELGLFPGLAYSGPGFDAGPGDTWQISFTHQWAQPFIGPVVKSGVNNCSIFFRYGVTIWNPATNHFDAWYQSLPLHPIIQNASENVDGPGPIPYVESFVVPANFPRATYQFAICVLPNTFTQAVWDNPSATRGYRYYLWINDVDLELNAVGGAGSGSSPGDSFYHFWPTPRYAVGSPGVIPNFATPELGADVGLVWDQFSLSSAFPLQIAKSALPHIGVRPTGPGVLLCFAIFQDDSIGPVYLGPPTYEGWYTTALPDAWRIRFGSLGSASFGNGIPGLVPLPPTATVDFGAFPGFGDPFTFICGTHRTRLASIDYMVSGVQEYATRNIFGSTEYGDLAPGFVVCWHPEIRPNGNTFLSNTIGFSAVGPDQEFDYVIACPGVESTGIHIWRRQPLRS